jgi:hypothetical protein
LQGSFGVKRAKSPFRALAVAQNGHPPLPYGALLGYTTMLVAFSTIFVSLKRRRDVGLGGVIRFWPAFAMGLGISLVASIAYVLAWEAALAVTHMDFAGDYGRALLARQQAEGASDEALAKLADEMARFRAQYARPLYRYAVTFTEIFPVGVLVSLVSAGLLRNSRFLPARRRPPAARSAPIAVQRNSR